jgi:hypothetical protein
MLVLFSTALAESVISANHIIGTLTPFVDVGGAEGMGANRDVV